MAEIREICDDITIMRDGTYVGSWSMNDITDDEIVKQMVGRELTNIYPPKNDAEVGEVLLDVKNYSSIHGVPSRTVRSSFEEARSWASAAWWRAEDRADGSDFRYAPHLNRRAESRVRRHMFSVLRMQSGQVSV